MSQQESMPEPQRSRNAGEAQEDVREEERLRQPYNARRTSDMPKQEHASSFAEDTPSYGYRAQDSMPRPESARGREQSRAQQTYTTGQYGASARRPPFASQVPQWARAPQRGQNSHLMRNIVIIMLLLLIIPILLRILLFFLALFAALFFGIAIIVLAAIILFRILLK